MSDRQLQPSDRDPFELEFAAWLKTARMAAGLSARQLADKANAGAALICAYEAGRRMPYLGAADRLVRVLGYDGFADFLTACTTCMNRPRPGTVCGTCGLPEVRVTVLPVAEQRAYARLRDTILGGDRP